MAGRSPNSANPVVRTEVEIPSNNTETIPPEKPGFWELVCSLSPEQWWSGTQGEKGYKVYLYRDNPRGPGQGSGYIRLINHFFDVEFVKQEFGGYDYHALLNDPSGAMVARANFSISAPPKGIVDASSPQNGSQPAAAPGDSSFQAQVLREMRESNERTHRLMERIMTDRSSPVAGDPLGIVAPVVQGIVTMFSNAMPKAADPLETFARIQQLMPKPPDMFEVLLKAKEVGLLGAAGMGGGNLMDQLGVLKTLAGELGWVAGGNGTRARPWYEFLMEKIVEKGPDILSGIGTIVDKYNAVEQTRLRTITAAANLQRPPAPPAQIPPAAPGAPAPAAAAPAPQQPANFPNVPNLELEPIGAPPAAAAPGAVAQQMIPEGVMTEIDAAKIKMVEAIAQGDAGGGDIVSFLAIMNPQLLDSLRPFTVDQIAQLCANDPILRQATQLPNFRQVLEEIVEVLQEGPEEPEAEQVN